MTHVTLPPSLLQKALAEIKQHLAAAYRKENETAPEPDTNCLEQAAGLWLEQMLNELLIKQVIPDFDTVRDTRMQQVLLFEYLRNRTALQRARIEAVGVSKATAILISDGLRYFSDPT